MRALPPVDATELSRISRTGVIRDLGRGGGFILVSVVGVGIVLSRSWFTFWSWGREVTGVDGGKMGAGCRFGVGAIETKLKSVKI